MRYWSDSLQKLFDSEDALLSAEAEKAAKDEERHKVEIKKAMEERKARAELDKARQAAEDASKHYQSLLAEYCKKYGAYTYSGKFPASDILGNLAHELGIF